MGISKEVFHATAGFQFDRYSEDIELSLRIRKAGFQSWLIPDALVYHKRRDTLPGFFRQVRNFGRGRIEAARVHSGTLRPTHFLPLIFSLGLVCGLCIGFVNALLLNATLLLYGCYLLLIFCGALISTHSLSAALLAVPSAIVQLSGYAWGFLSALVKSR